ncbi:glyoxylate/hydroxypyruvate reductase A [uncultured Litoreibacter sp.]|uniref:2-hydroxyacid dehydrogenase n=1 Tax=uncultured Litoreibacter sp. TaxID=1392394 RepID=UPI00262E4238|nr:glyoxylate/hydroxypyruvate reductase A [uncultured Litoreibacter sp.]
MTQILFTAGAERWAQYEAPLRAALDATELNYTLGTDLPAQKVDYLVYAPGGPVSDFTPFTRAKAVLGLWAGVESIVTNETLTQPLCRMVDDGLTDGMVEWVTGHVMRHHLGMDTHIHGQDGHWRGGIVPPLARGRKVCMLGLGALGAACAQQLVSLKFDVHGWARSAKTVEGVTCHEGEAGLDQALSAAEFVVLLLPDTAATQNVLNARTLGLLKRGAFVVNPGRGPLIDDEALLAALDTGQLAHATLDVFREEPLPADHPFWPHPGVTVTPHIASETRPETASAVIADNIRRGEAGLELLHLVDRAAGY